MATTKVRGELVDLNEATSESGLKIPSGTNNNRPTAAAGQIRNNTNETSEFSASCEEYYNGTEWKKINNTALPPPLAFKTLLYTGNGSTQSITGAGFQPDFVWIKSRSNTYGHRLIDSTTGPDNYLESNSTAAQQGAGGAGLTSFDSDGFSVGSGNAHNANAATFVAWCWKANGGTTSSNTDGNNTTTVQVFGQAGFSLVKCASITTDPGTFGHGLNAVPKVIIVKRISGSGGWQTYHESIGNSGRIELQSTAAQTGGVWNSTSPTSTVFSYDGLSLGEDFIAYCFAEVAGFSSFGGYTGNGSSTSVSLGFEPDFVMWKATNNVENWYMMDSARGVNNVLYADDTFAEGTSSGVSFTSTGFTVTSSFNQSGRTFIYMAFKNNPTPQPAAGYMSFLVVAGGGSGGNENARSGGGAGAGGLRTSYGSTSGGGASAESDITLAAGTYTITVGAGGAGTSSTPSAGNDGSLSSIAASSITTISSVGGGGGGAPGTGRTGGSGGGGAHGGNAGGSGTANQGFDGGSGNGESPYNGAGGGGASAVGANSSAGGGSGAGGDGLSVSIIGSATAYAGGGGGGGGTAASGGTGGGGSGSTSNAGGATANTGGGGGGARTGSGAGGSGVVILRLATSEYSGTTTGSPTVTTDGDYTILTYTGSGTYVHS